MEYDLIIVGGRPAGSSLAARLGARGMKVLVVDRATFPSLPGVPSSPILHPGAMALVDELGVDESTYGHPDARMRSLRIDMAGLFEAVMPMPMAANGRDYTYGIERTSFDNALWENLARYPSVERRTGFTMTDLVREGNRVIGIVGSQKGGPEERLTARGVVGADGRFSLVARKVSAPVEEVADDHTSTVYYCDWEGVLPVHEEHPAGLIHATARGLDILFFAMPNGRWSVNTHARSDRVQVNGDAERYYMDTIRSIPTIWRHLEKAERVSPLIGLKKISNGYRRASGPGWVLTGDALHYKDPVDGQGIYDALLETKLLDGAIALWSSGSRSWEDAMAGYRKAVWEATHSMFLTTVGRLRRELYDEPPLPVMKTMIRWTLTDPEYQECFLRVISRDIPPERMTSKALMARAIARGVARDIGSLVRGRAR
ncbi:MAG: NAD(P)/FAD-dependent oxidoreductase [Polyangiaceae bacterium]